jgi:hypothetical protein
MRWSAIAGLVALTLTPSIAGAKREPRSGFTVEAGGGGGAYRQTLDGATNTYGAFTFTLGVGAFLSPKFALLYRSYAAYGLVGKLPGFSAHALNVQYWPTTSFFIGGGGGLALQFPRGLMSGKTGIGENPYGEIRVGGMLTARVGFAFIDTPHHSVRVALEVVPVFVRESNALSSGLQIEWQYL